jgi:hypothetical protein
MLLILRKFFVRNFAYLSGCQKPDDTFESVSSIMIIGRAVLSFAGAHGHPELKEPF